MVIEMGEAGFLSDTIAVIKDLDEEGKKEVAERPYALPLWTSTLRSWLLDPFPDPRHTYFE